MGLPERIADDTGGGSFRGWSVQLPSQVECELGQPFDEVIRYPLRVEAELLVDGDRLRERVGGVVHPIIQPTEPLRKWHRVGTRAEMAFCEGFKREKR